MQEKDIMCYQLDLTKREESIELLKELQNSESLIIGIELTDIEISRYCHLSLDPQHSDIANSNITSIEMVYKYRDKLLKMMTIFKTCSLITVKPDLDSIGAIVLAKLTMSHNLELTGDMLLRLIAIANSDRHGSVSKWNKHRRINYFNEPLFSKHGIPIGLLSAIGSQHDTIETKVRYMTDYIVTGTFEKLDKYTAIMLKKNEASTKTTDVEIVVDNKLVYVESNYRGAVGLGYRYAPVVLARNPNYRFGQAKTKGVKYTIAQFNSNHVNISKILDRLNALEPGWGGNSETIIGSSQTQPSALTKDEILNIIKQEC